MGKIKSNSIITVDVYNDKFYKFTGGSFALLRKLKASKTDTIISYISNSDLIVEPIDVSSNIPDDEVENVIIDKVYDELRLDTAIEYQVYPVKVGTEGSLTKYQTVIIDKSKLKDVFESVAKKTNYIDYIVPAPLLYKSLYSIKKLSTGQNHLFIYFGDSDCYVTFYKNGNYAYSKSINYSLKHMYARVSQLAQEVFISEDEFRNQLKNGSYKNSEGKLKELLTQVLNECFLSINDILVYTKRVYNLDKIHKAYTGFSWGYIEGIESYVKNYLNLDSSSLGSIYSNADPSSLIDPNHALMIFIEKEMRSDIIDIPNLTPYPKPKPFSKRPASQLIAIVTFAIIGAIALPAYNYVGGLTTQVKNKVLDKKRKKIVTEKKDLEKKIKDKRESLEAVNKQLSLLRIDFNDKKGKLVEVHDKKFKYRLKSEQLLEITKLISEYQIYSKNITITDTMYSIDLESKDDKEITSFVKALVKKFNFTIYNINLDDIRYDEEYRIYKGVVKIEFRKDF